MTRVRSTTIRAGALILITAIWSVVGASAAVAGDRNPAHLRVGIEADRLGEVAQTAPAESIETITVRIQLPEVSAVLRQVVCWVSSAASRLVHDWMPVPHDVETASHSYSSPPLGQSRS